MTTLFRFSLTSGLIMGLVMVLLDVLSSFISFPMNILAVIELVILIVMAVFILRYYKTNIMGGSLLLSDAIRIGMLTGFSAGIIAGFAAFLQIKYIDSSAVDQYVSVINADNSLTEAEKITSIEALYSPLYLVSAQCFVLSIVGFVIFLVIGLFLKQEKTIFEDNKNQN